MDQPTFHRFRSYPHCATCGARNRSGPRNAATNSRYRLLILLSDGKPNDVDHYEGRYGVEDMRQAVAEARLQAIHPFCITVDRHAPHYLARVFGARHYAVLRQAETLPVVLADVLRRLIQR